MQFAIPAIENATEEIEKANAYPLIRLFTVGQGTGGALRGENPLNDLQTIQQNWSVTSNKTIAGDGGFGYFSAVCWIFGRTIFDKLGGKVPLGLVSNNWVSGSDSEGCLYVMYHHSSCLLGWHSR
jgi:sialate O-acetylesterase